MSDPPSNHELAYAGADVQVTRDRLRGIGVSSTIVACVGLITCVAIGRLVLAALSEARADVRRFDAAVAKSATDQAAAYAAERDASIWPPVRGLTPTEASATIAGITKACERDALAPTRLTESQLRTLADKLSTKGQPLVDPSSLVQYDDFDDEAVGSHIWAKWKENGKIEVRSTRGAAAARTRCDMVIDPSGEIDFECVLSPAGRFTTLRGGEYKSHESAYVPPTDADSNHQYEAHSRFRAAVPAAIFCGLNLVLAALLMVAAAFLLIRGDRERSVRLHRCYVLAKLPVSFVGALFLAELFSHYMIFGQLWAVPGLAGCFYPVILLWKLRSLQPELP